MAVSDALGDFSVASTSISGLLIVIIGFVIRSIIKGDLVPRSTVDRLVDERDARIAAQGEALTTASSVVAELSSANSTLADSNRDFAEASHLQVRLAEALHKNLPPSGGDPP